MAKVNNYGTLPGYDQWLTHEPHYDPEDQPTWPCEAAGCRESNHDEDEQYCLVHRYLRLDPINAALQLADFTSAETLETEEAN